MSNKNPLSRKENIVVQELNDEIMIYDLDKNSAFCLNQTSAIVWQLCNGENSISQINNELSKKLNSKSSEDLVWLALDKLKKENLVTYEVEEDNPFYQMSRREAIRKVGLGTMIALPIISSIVSPTSVQAGSCVAVNGACTVNAQCCPGGSPALTCVSNKCCNGTGTLSTAAPGVIVPNTVGNCGAGSTAARAAVCDALCCEAAATGTNTVCSGGPSGTLTCSCV